MCKFGRKLINEQSEFRVMLIVLDLSKETSLITYMHMYTGEMYIKGCIDSFETSDFNSTLLKHHFIHHGIVSRCVHGVISRNKINTSTNYFT